MRHQNHRSYGVRVHASVTDAGPSALDHLAAAFTTTLFLADVDPSAAAEGAATAATEVKKSGWFDSIFVGPLENFLKLIDRGIQAAGIPYSYGFAIIVLTLLVKLATYPLSAKQVESTLSMQSLQPRVKELQAKYANDQERLQIETAKLYQNAGVNPLAGCLPLFATIPVFIGLYRALSNVANEGLLTEGFFWIPSLAGPTKLNGGLGWLVPQDGVPPLGWHDTLSYLVLPVLLVASQYASQKIISPPQSNDPQQQQSQAILKFLPLMIGYFSLNVPSGLTLYWITNNIVTTLQQVYLRQKFNPDAAAASSGATSSTPAVSLKSDIPRQPTGKEMNARRSSKAAASTSEVIDVTPEAPVASTSVDSSSSRGEKFRAIKAREAAMKAAEQAGEEDNAQVSTESAPSSNGSVAVEASEETKLEVPDAPPSKRSATKGKGKGAKKGSRKKK